MSYLDKLEKLVVVADDMTKEYLADKSEIQEVFEKAKIEVLNYIHTLVDKEDVYSIEFSMPFGGFWSLHLSFYEDCREMYRFPFGSCDRGLWKKLLEDKNNPLFRLLRFMQSNIAILRRMLKERELEIYDGVFNDFNLCKSFDEKVLEYFDIFDNLGVIHYIFIYEDVDSFLNGEIENLLEKEC